MLRPEEAAALAGLTAREVYRLAEAGSIHFAETADGLLLICPRLLPLRGGIFLPEAGT